VEVEQGGQECAGYGEGLMKRVAARLSTRFGKRFIAPNLRNMRFRIEEPREVGGDHGKPEQEGG
jgi:hypothetical protein